MVSAELRHVNVDGLVSGRPLVQGSTGRAELRELMLEAPAASIIPTVLMLLMLLLLLLLPLLLLFAVLGTVCS